ncbi:MAG: hypothetical protein EXR79_02120 [Myxococcales bacterium]|nr:hypothetical protein [Myxococcales bacterium]
MTEFATNTRSPLAHMLAALAALVCVAGAATWVFVARNAAHAVQPSDASLAAAAHWIDAAVQPGDALSFQPDWSAAQRWRFVASWTRRGLDANAALVLGAPLVAWDLDGFRRVWVVSTHGLGAKVHVRAPARLQTARSFGHGTEVGLWTLAPSLTVKDLGRALGEAVVERDQPDGSWSACTWRGSSFDCGPESWKTVLHDLAQVGSGRRPCIHVTPHRDGGRTRLTWHGVPAARRLEGHFGLRMWAVRNEVGSDLRFRVRVGDDVVYERAAERSEFAWQPWHVDLAPGQRGLDVSFEVFAAEHSWRYGCFDARLTGAAEPVAQPAFLVPAVPPLAPPTPTVDPIAVPPALVGPGGRIVPMLPPVVPTPPAVPAPSGSPAPN